MLTCLRLGSKLHINISYATAIHLICFFPFFFFFKEFCYLPRQKSKEKIYIHVCACICVYFQQAWKACNTKHIKNIHGQASKHNHHRRKKNQVLSTDTEAGGNELAEACICGILSLFSEMLMCNLNIIP